jgi:pimeloyl-ACP methyl ester carboxylesterase
MWPDKTLPPADFTWWDHADDLIAFLEFRARSGAAELPIIGMGHSIGAVVTLMAAVKRPDLFSRLVLMDPATSPGFSAVDFRQEDPQTRPRLVEKTLKRRERWSSVEEFREYLPTRPAYAQFVAEALDDYAVAGLTQSEDGYELAYRTVWEAHNFATTPDIAPLLAEVALPTLLLFGEQSPMYSTEGLARAADAFSPFITTQMVAQAGHLIPQENPGLTWQLIERWLAQP